MNFKTVYWGPQPDNFINKILRILKPSGKLILAFKDRAQLESRPLSTNMLHFYHRDEIVTLLNRSIHRKLHLDQIEEFLSNRNAAGQPADR